MPKPFTRSPILYMLSYLENYEKRTVPYSSRSKRDAAISNYEEQFGETTFEQFEIDSSVPNQAVML